LTVLYSEQDHDGRGWVDELTELLGEKAYAELAAMCKRRSKLGPVSAHPATQIAE
jgi:hypothetical protein